MRVDKVKKVILMAIPMSICNLRCHYCYLAQRDESFQGDQPKIKYAPEQVAKALSPERIGGFAYMNFCADGETLLTKDLDLYIKPLLEQGHYIELVTNMTITPVLNKFLSWDKSLLSHLEFKCSFHYLELKKRGLLETFADNVNRAWRSGASANIEITPSDELIPYLEEVKEFSLEHFGALPHLTIARNDNTNKIERLTALTLDEYNKVWSQFDSNFWNYKSEIYGVKQKDFCYAGKWSLYINMATGQAFQCYRGNSLGDVFAEPCLPIAEQAIGRCRTAHCYNGHSLMTLGLIPYATNVRYGDIRNRKRMDGSEWLQPELKAFFNSQLKESNVEIGGYKKCVAYAESDYAWFKHLVVVGKDIISTKVNSLKGK